MPSEVEFINKINRNDSLLEEVFSFDPRNLESTNSATISKYTIALAQYVIYLNSHINKKKVSLMQKRRMIELSVNQSETKAKTKAEKKAKVIQDDPALLVIEGGINTLEDELGLLDGTVNYFVELINTFKRELTRREKEIEWNRYERRS